MKDEDYPDYYQKEIEDEDLPAILACCVILAICIYGLIRFWPYV